MYPNWGPPPPPAPAGPYSGFGHASSMHGPVQQLPRPYATQQAPAGPGPPSSLTQSFSGCISLLRVVPAEGIRLDSPVHVGAALIPSTASISSGTFKAGDLEVEKAIMDKATQPAAQHFFESTPDAMEAVVDADTAQLTSMGYSRTAACLAAAYKRVQRAPPEKAVDFARNYTELTTEMGFAPMLAAGALLKHGNKVEDAADACLAVSASEH